MLIVQIGFLLGRRYGKNGVSYYKIRVIITTQKGMTGMENRRPISEIMAKIKEIIKQNGYGAASLSDKIVDSGIKPDMNRGRIERAFYHGVNQLSYVQSLDDTLEAILTLFGLTTDDVYRMLLKKEPEYMDEEERLYVEFARDPETRQFMKIAMAQYKLKMAQEELEKLNKEIK